MQLPWQHVHFTGIGGVGMAGLALILRDFRLKVSGTDLVDSANMQLLAHHGATVAVGHDAIHVNSPDLLVYSSAVQESNPERLRAAELGIPQMRRGDFLAEIAVFFPRRVSCAGTHGKTSTSAMLSHILIELGEDPGYMVGGTVPGRNVPATAGCGEILITEVDESDGTQSEMRSSHAIITNIEDDHCWSLGGVEKLENCFREFAFKSDFVLAYDTPATRRILGDHPNIEFVAEHEIPIDFPIPIPGLHNRINGFLAARMAARLGHPEGEVLDAIASYRGVERRQSLRFEGYGIRVIEDYAHHPTEVRATIQALREAYPGTRLTVVFQPHRFERIARYGEQFSKELAKADNVIVTPPFAAWLQDSAKADPRTIAAGITGIPACYDDSGYAELATALAKSAKAGDVIAVFGAGTISDLIPPLVDALKTAE